MKMKKKTIGIVIGIAIIIIGVGGFLGYRNNEVKKYNSKINEQFQKMNDLKGEAYFQAKHSEELDNLQQKYDKVQNSNKLSDLKELSNEVNVLVENTTKEIDSYNKYYKLLKEEIETSDKLLRNYFSREYDLSKINETKTNASNAIDSSDFTNYEEIYSSLASQDKALNQYIEDEMNKIYNVPTELSEQYPFGVDAAEMSTDWSYEPLVKQNKNFPTWVITSEADTLDGEPYANLFIEGSSAEYYYNIDQIDTKKITVQDENRELKDALVNTEVTFKKQEDYSTDEYTALNERPAYLLKMKSGEIYLALQDYDGNEFYILYSAK